MDTTGQKNIEGRRGRAKKGDVAVFACMPYYSLWIN
jgi:hypothetical protein